MKAFGPNAQEPELASNVSGDPIWIVGAVSSTPAPASASSAAVPASGAASDAAPSAAEAMAELEAIRRLASPEDAAERLEALVGKLPDGDLADLARQRLRASRSKTTRWP